MSSDKKECCGQVMELTAKYTRPINGQRKGLVDTQRITVLNCQCCGKRQVLQTPIDKGWR